MLDPRFSPGEERNQRLWLLRLNQHFLNDKLTVRQQVEQKLQVWQTLSPAVLPSGRAPPAV